MKNRSKWIEDVSVDDSVSRAARVTLKSRLANVAHFLELAARHADKTDDHVHQLRVSTRRSVAALVVYGELLPKKQKKWFHKQLRRIRRAAGGARDLDVFLERYQHESGTDHLEFLRQMKKRRRKAQKPIVRLHEELMKTGRLKLRVKRLLKSIRRRRIDSALPLADWARSRFADTAGKFFETVPTPASDLEGLHRFRVRGKELRYSMELFGNLFSPEFRKSAYPLVTQLQQKLGELNDHATACQFLQAWVEQAEGPVSVDYLRGLIDRERRQLEISVAKFHRWWTPAMAAELRRTLLVTTLGEGKIRYGVYPS